MYLRQRWIGDQLGDRGHTPISIVAPVATVPQVREGKLRALAVTARRVC